jgi:dihydroorotase
VIARSTWNPAREIHHEELGNLSVGSPADVAVLRVENGKFGFTDMYGARMDGKQRLVAELTLRDGKVVYDLNGITRPEWKTLPKGYTRTGDAAWDAVTPAAAPRKR